MNDNVVNFPNRHPAAEIESHAAEVTRLAEEIVRLFEARAGQPDIDEWLTAMHEAGARLRALGGVLMNDEEKRRLDSASEALSYLIAKARQVLAREQETGSTSSSE